MLFRPLSFPLLSCSVTLISHSNPDLHLKDTFQDSLTVSLHLILSNSLSPLNFWVNSIFTSDTILLMNKSTWAVCSCRPKWPKFTTEEWCLVVLNWKRDIPEGLTHICLSANASVVIVYQTIPPTIFFGKQLSGWNLCLSASTTG